MSEHKLMKIDYALADIGALARPTLDAIEPRELRFLQYPNSFVALSGEASAKDRVTLADVNAFISASGRPLQHRILVWVAAKYLKGAEFEHTARARIFASDKAAQRYLGWAGDDDLSEDDDDIYTSLRTCAIDDVGELDPCSCIVQMNQEDALEALSPAKPGPEQGGTMDAHGKRIEASAETLKNLADGWPPSRGAQILVRFLALHRQRLLASSYPGREQAVHQVTGMLQACCY